MSQATGGPDYSPESRPERPAVSLRAPAPVLTQERAPRAIDLATSSWRSAVAISMFAALTMVLVRSAVVAHMAQLLRDRGSGLGESTIEAAARLTLVTAIVSLALLALLEWIVLRRLGRRRGWPRLVLLLLALVHLGVALVAGALVVPDGWQGWLLLATLLGGALLAVAGAALALSPSVGRWLRGEGGLGD